jgi:hypothetical protein
MTQCPICGSAVEPQRFTDYGERMFVGCPVCGHYGITRQALHALGAIAQQWRAANMVLSHAVRQITAGAVRRHSPDTPVLDKAQVEQILENRVAPSVREQSNNLVRWIGDQLRASDPSGSVTLHSLQFASIMGAASQRSAMSVAWALVDQGILTDGLATDLSGGSTGLTFKGWDIYEQLQRDHSEGPIAFMAMPFNEADLDALYRECFRRECVLARSS